MRQSQLKRFERMRAVTLAACTSAAAFQSAAFAEAKLTKPEVVISHPAKEPGVCQPSVDETATADSGVAAGDRVRVVVRSYQTAAISAEINARITRLPEREGDRFSKGDVLVEFDCRRLAAELSAARAIVKARQAVFDTERQRLQYKSTGTLALEQAHAELEKANADAEGAEARRTSCQIIAPFDGRVTEKVAQVHEIAQTNQPVIRIVNESKLELMLMVPSHWLERIPAGTAFRVKFDETGETHGARVLQSTGLIDPVSQSARVIAELVNQRATVAPGMSGTAMFTFPKDAK